jgi:hypothetical protein
MGTIDVGAPRGEGTNMIERREVLLGGAMLASMPAMLRATLPVPGDRLGFDIVRKGAKLGTHQLSFTRSGDALTVQIVVDLVVKIGFITVYRYSHHATERWDGDQLVALQTTTVANGTSSEVSGRRDASGLAIEGTKAPRYVAPANALLATHWNRRELDGPLINAQDGRLMRPKIVPVGSDMIPTASGAQIRASQYSMGGDVPLDIWYDSRPSWAGLSFKVMDGSTIRYERQ